MASQPDCLEMIRRPTSFSSNIATKKIPQKLVARQFAVEPPTYSHVMRVFPIQWVNVLDTRDAADDEWQIFLRETANVTKAAHIAAPLRTAKLVLGQFRQGLLIIALGIVLAALTLAFNTVVLPIAAGAAMFIGCVLAADAVERYRRGG